LGAPYIRFEHGHGVSANEPKLLGGQLCVWNDNLGIGYDEYEVYNAMKLAAQVMAEKMWSGTTGVSWDSFLATVKKTGNAPGTNLERIIPVPGNVAAGKTAYASSVETNSAFTPDLAVDSKKLTHWSSGKTDNEWIYVDLGRQYDVNRVALSWSGRYYRAFAKSYKIQTTDDPTAWRDVYTTTSGNGNTDEISFPLTKCRYIRMLASARNDATQGYGLAEFEIYSPTMICNGIMSATRSFGTVRTIFKVFGNGFRIPRALAGAQTRITLWSLNGKKLGEMVVPAQRAVVTLQDLTGNRISGITIVKAERIHHRSSLNNHATPH
jgi:hypothetical protein